MESNSIGKTVTFTDLTERKDVSVSGPGNFFVGLSTTGDLTIETREEDLCMTLLAFTLHENGGCTLSPANNDLACYINNSPEPLDTEIHLVDGTKLEIADKKLIFVDGRAPERRRKLPRTPGIPFGEPPPKPVRRSVDATSETNGIQTTAETVDVTAGHDNVTDDDDERKWLENSWCLLDLPGSEQDTVKGLQTPEQIAILTASYFTKQLRMFTDASITAQLLDDIFKLFMDTIEFNRETYMNYLADITKTLTTAPDRTQTRPMHGPAVRFLTELLKQCFDPVDRVILILDLLRTFSHFDNNLDTMVTCQTAAVILGSMTAYQDVVEVQQYGMDILAKIAKYQPTLDKKAPLREVGVDMLLLGIKHHAKDLPLARSTCRVLATLASTLIAVINNWLDTEEPRDDSVREGVEKYEALLEYVFQQGIPVVQGVMKSFGTDLGVNTEGRKFIFYYAKLQQLHIKKTSWIKKSTDGSEDEEAVKSSQIVDRDSDDDDQTVQQLLVGNKVEEEPKSILKRIGSYENLRTNEKRIVFADNTLGGSDTETTYSSDSEGERLSPEGCQEPGVANEEDDFSRQVVHHFVRQTIRRRSSQLGNESDQDADDSDSEHEFLQSLSALQKSADTGRQNSVQADNYTIDNDNAVKTLGGFEKGQPLTGASSVSDETEEVISRTDDNSSCSNSNSAGENANNTQLTTDGSYETKINSEPSEEKVEEDVFKRGVGPVDRIKVLERSISEDMRQSAIRDVTFLGKLVRTQIIVYVGSLVFQGEDSTVLMVIDKPIQTLLEDADAPVELVVFARNQYGDKMTLMDLEPAIVISVIDAVRYRSVTKELVQSAVLNLTRSLSGSLLPATIQTAMQFFKTSFADPHLSGVLRDEEFLKDYRNCFQKATERMEQSHTIDDIRANLAPQTSAI